MGQVIVLELENCLLVSFGYDDVTVTWLKFTLRDDLGYHCSKWSLDTKYSQIQESKLENVSFWFWVMACHVPKLFSWDAQLNDCPGFHHQIWCLFILEVGIISGLEAHGRGSSLRFRLKIKDANHVNTTWPSGSQEEIKISDALSGGCQIEQLKESLHLHMGNKVLENENTHTHMQTKPQVLNVHSVFHIVPHLVDLAFFFTRLVTSP